MNLRRAFGRGGVVAGACAACCVPPIVGALGVTAGLAAAAGIFVVLAGVIAVALIGASWIRARRRRHRAPGGCNAPVVAIAIGDTKRSASPERPSAPGNLLR